MKHTVNTILMECKRFIVTIGYEIICSRERSSLTKCKERMAELYHGRPEDSSFASVCDLFCSSRGVFYNTEKIFYKEIIQITDANANKTVKESIFLKSVLTRDPNVKFTVGANSECDINLNLLRRTTLNSKNLIAGRTLWGYANDIVLRNCKKACVIVESRLDSTGNLPSRKKEEDFYNHVLEEMYKVLEKSDKPVVEINQEDVDDENKDDSNVSNNNSMPENFYICMSILSLVHYHP